MAAFSAYYDESYTHHDAKPPHVFAVGGYVAFTHHWTGFDARWKQVLDGWDLPFFHMSDYEQDRPPYEAKHQRTFRQLVRVIHEHKIQPLVFFTTFDGKMSKEIFAQLYGRLFRFAIETTVTTYGTVDDEGKLAGDDDRFVFFFDRIPDPSLRATCRTWFDHARESAPWARKLVTADFYDKKTYRPIQAADVLAFDMMRNSRRAAKQPMRFSTIQLLKKRDVHLWRLDFT